MARLALLLALLVVPLTGCGGSAVMVQRTNTGGVLGLEGERVQAMADARRQMSEQCGGAYTIVGERSAVTGVHRGQTLSEDLVEYACGAGAEPPPKP